jgi:hypothetical protein
MRTKVVDRGTVAARSAHDLGLAAWFGGAFMGAVAMNGATREVDDPTQRTRVANAGWFRWAPIAGLAMAAHLAGSLVLWRSAGTGARAGRGLGRVRAAVTVVAIVATAETGRSGNQVVRAGDVPVATAVQPIAATPPPVAAAQRRLRVAQWVVPAATATIFVLNAVQDERGWRATLLGGNRRGVTASARPGR